MQQKQILKNATCADTLKFAKKVDLASLKSEVYELDTDELSKVPTELNSLKSRVDKLDVVKLVPVPVDWSKLSDVVKMMLLKRSNIILRSKILSRILNL